jgi:hypothetical protein
MTDRKQISKLESLGLGVTKLSFYHYRVAERFDIFPNERGQDWRWHDLVTDQRGECNPRDLHSFVPGFLKAHPAPERISTARELAEVAEPGWWNCPVFRCPFKMRDDGTSQTAKRQIEHLELHEVQERAETGQ